MLGDDVRLTKHHALGNDFLVLVADAVPADAPTIARRLCHRTRGVGADGLVVAVVDEAATAAGLAAVFHLFNADGSPAEVSGNGLACLGQALARPRHEPTVDLLVGTVAGPRRVHVDLVAETGHGADTVEVGVEMGPVAPGPAYAGDPLVDAVGADEAARLGEVRWATGDIGNPHVVIEVADPSTVAIDRIGPAVEARFGAVNVHVIAPGPGPHSLRMAIWERGAGVTAACGSGACVAAHVARRWHLVGDRVAVHMPGGVAHVELAGDAATLLVPATYVAAVEAPDA